MDDLMSGHVDPKVNDDFENWLNEMHGNYSKVKSVRGPMHDFLGVVAVPWIPCMRVVRDSTLTGLSEGQTTHSRHQS